VAEVDPSEAAVSTPKIAAEAGYPGVPAADAAADAAEARAAAEAGHAPVAAAETAAAEDSAGPFPSATALHAVPRCRCLGRLQMRLTHVAAAEVALHTWKIAAAGLGDASEVRAAAEVGDASEVWAAAEDEEESFQGIPPMGDTLPSLSLPSIHARSRALPASHEGPKS
jgi:hypothetical protein